MANLDFKTFFSGRASGGQLSGAGTVLGIGAGVTKQFTQTNLTWINVIAGGLVADGSTDNSTAFNALVQANKATKGVTYYFPRGDYKFGSPIDLTDSLNFNIVGDAKETSNNHVATVLNAAFSGILLNIDFGVSNGTFTISNLQLRNDDPLGVCVYTNNATQCKFESVLFYGGQASSYTDATNVTNICLKMESDFGTNLYCCSFRNTGVGVMVNSGSGGSGMFGCDFEGCVEAVRACGSGFSATDTRVEVCVWGWRLGYYFDNSHNSLTSSKIAGASMEGNLCGFDCHSVGASTIQAINCLLENSTQGQSQYGLYLNGGNVLTVLDCTFGGSASQACISDNFTTDANSSVIFKNVRTNNGLSGGKQWDLQDDSTVYSFENCSYQPRPDDGATAEFNGQGFVGNSVQSRNLIQPYQQGRNLGHVDLPVAQNASSVAVVFGIDIGAGGNSCTLAQSAGGSLTLLHKYYFRAATVTPVGESPGAESNITLTGSNRTITITFSSVGFAGFYRRRVYVSDGSTDLFGNRVYQGYLETAIGGAASVVYTGQAFDGLKSYHAQDQTSMQEPDAHYGVGVSTSWGTTIAISAKAVTGFTITFGTNAPGSGSPTLDWWIYRAPYGTGQVF